MNEYTRKSNATILVADDDPYIQEALKDRLASLGYQVIQAQDGKEALDLILRQAPHLAFLDVEMPGMRGIDVLKQVRRHKLDFPVVMITAFGTIDLAVEAMKEGAFDFLPKPFKGNHVALVIEKALEQQRLKQHIAQDAGEPVVRRSAGRDAKAGRLAR